MRKAYIGKEVIASCPTEDGGEVGVREVFFVCWEQGIREGESCEELLLSLLNNPDPFDKTFKCDGEVGYLLRPYHDLVSPWSSKASDVLHRCGLADVIKRVERGRYFPPAAEYFLVDYGIGFPFRDRMTEDLDSDVRGYLDAGGKKSDVFNDWRVLFDEGDKESGGDVRLLTEQLSEYNNSEGLALSDVEIKYLADLYRTRKATLAELMMFAQANSEHCRHKIFNAGWEGNDKESLMNMIRRTHAANPTGVVTAFADNAAVIKAAAGEDFAPDKHGVYRRGEGGLYVVAKAETHNHPTAISPYPGAATGSGGEIRDEAAAGRGAMSCAGFSGYIVSDLSPGRHSPEKIPSHIKSPIEIMTDAPLGAAAFNNEFGRPALAGFYRTLSEKIGNRYIGFLKPVMLAGGVGQMLPFAAGKKPIPPGAKIVQLGGPGFRIGIGGGSASSRTDGGDEELDFNSVQRDNPQMQRRAQAVLDVFRRRQDSPILSLHDVGAGGLANAVCELVHDAGVGARIQMKDIPLGQQGLTAAEIWCNESQERYVLALAAHGEEEFRRVCEREHCPFAVIGEATERADIVVINDMNRDAAVAEESVNLPLDSVLGKLPLPKRRAAPLPPSPCDGALSWQGEFADIAQEILRHPTVSCKRFLITIGDRTVGGLSAREQMVGPWQTPVADCATICNDFTDNGGVAFALGERASVAALHPAAASRLAIAEALLNLAAADVELQNIKLSLNWMANCGDAERDGELRAAVQAASDFCVALGVGVIVGKDSLSMRMQTAQGVVEAPAFAAAFAFAPTDDANAALTPQLCGRDDTVLMLLRFSRRKPRLAGAVAAAHCQPPPQQTPDIEASALRAGLTFLRRCRREGLILSYHDCSDGGLWAALCEMGFAANRGLDIFTETLAVAPETDGINADGALAAAATALFNEEVGAVFEVTEESVPRVLDLLVAENGDGGDLSVQAIARPTGNDRAVCVYGGGGALIKKTLSDLRRTWEKTGNVIAQRRDNPACVEQEESRDYDNDGGLFAELPQELTLNFYTGGGVRPRAAILREQGTNGHREMAAALTQAGFDAIDLTMSDIAAGRATLDDFKIAAWCGGFSFGDVLGAGRGWAMTVRYNQRLRDVFSTFFHRSDTLTLGVCNGCQALSHVQMLMPNANKWNFPTFHVNESRRFEARLVMVEVMKSPSPLFAGMTGLKFPLVASHGEGRAVFADDGKQQSEALLRYVDNGGEKTEVYPYNPNGSAGGMTGFCSPDDGRVTIMMPHPERVFRRVQMGWQPPSSKHVDDNYTPWMKMFINARRFAG